MRLQVVLAPPALLVLADLGERRLPDVDERRALQMFGPDLLLLIIAGLPAGFALRGLAKQVGEESDEMIAHGGRQILPPDGGEPVELLLRRVSSSGHRWEPPRSRESRRLALSGPRSSRLWSKSATASSAATVTTGSATSATWAQRSREVIHPGMKLQVPSASWQRSPSSPATVRWRPVMLSVWPKNGCQG